MPIPKPSAKETQEDFIGRFMGDEVMQKDYPDQKQRAAVAYKEWRSSNGNPVMNDDDDDLKEYLLKVMGVPAGEQPRKNAKSCDICGQTPGKFYHLEKCAECGKEFCKDCYAKPGKEYGTHICKLCSERKNSRGQTGRSFPMRFIEPGLVRYNDVGDVLVTKEALDRMAASFVGKPIFNESHREVGKTDFKNGKADGIIGRVWNDPKDGWYWADAIIWDDETISNIKNGYSLSCAYDVPSTGWGPGGTHNNIPYDREVLNGEYTHLAIVPNPRYERARIIYNHGGHMKLKFWQKDKPTEAREMELVNAMTEVEGKEMPMEKVIELANAEMKRQEALENAKATDDSIIEVGGKKMTVKEAKVLAATALKNASEADMKEAHKDGKHDDKEMDNCPMCNAEDEDEKKKKAEEEERKNAEEKAKKEKEDKEKDEMENSARIQAHDKGEHKTKALENCLSCKAAKSMADARHFEELKNAAHTRQGKFKAPSIRSLADRVSEGDKKYGKK